MIHIFSNEFTVDKLDEVALTILIEDRCKLKLYTPNTDTYYFTGDSEGWLTTVPILKQDADNLGIEDYILLDDFKPTDHSLIEVDFNTILCKLIKSEVIYYEFCLESKIMTGTKITPTVTEAEVKTRYLTFW